MMDDHFNEDAGRPLSGTKLMLYPLNGSDIEITVSDSRGQFTFDQWQKMPAEVPPPLKPFWQY